MAPDSGTERSAGRSSTKRWLYAAVIVWTASFLTLAAFGVYVIYRSQQVTKQLCRVSDSNRSILLQMLDVAENQSLERATDVAERNLIRQGYGELRALIPPLKCSAKGGPQELEP